MMEKIKDLSNELLDRESSIGKIRKIEELLGFKINLEVNHDLECQILFDNRKDKVEEESLLDEYDDNIDTVSWESIEIASWELMKNKGISWKLFSVWLESLIYIYGWDDMLYPFKALKAVLTSKIELLLDQDDRVGCIEFSDRAFSRAMCLQPIKDEDCLFEYLNYKNTNPQKLFDALSTFDRKLYDDLFSIHAKCLALLSALPLLTKVVHIHFSKVLAMLKNLQEILLVYANNFISDDEDDEDEDISSQELLGKSQSSSTKEDAFASIAQSLALLQEVDPQNIAIPLLRKIMRWQEKNISEILHEINDREGAYFVLSFLMD